MKEEYYSQVPNIITGKDLDYLSDMFNWNYNALKKMNVATKNTEDKEINQIIMKGYNLFNNNLNVIISILNEGGQNEQ